MLRRKNVCRMGCLAALMCLTLLLIWENSLRSAPVSEMRSRCIAQWLVEMFGEAKAVDWLARHIRKAAHFMEYAALGALGALMLRAADTEKKGHYLLHLLFFCLLAAVLDEALQNFADRGSQVTDVLLDFSGALTGTGAVFALGKIFSILWEKKK